MKKQPQETTSPYTVTINHLPKSRVEIAGEITWEHFASFENQVFKKLAEHIEVPGFRKGNVPKDVAQKQIPDGLLLGDMAELAINSVFPLILKENSLDIIGRPEVSITKIARGNPLGFSIGAAVFPEIKLPDYKKIAATIPPEIPKDVTDTDTDKVIHDLQQMRAYGHVHHEGDVHEHAEPLPELNDEFAKSFGNFQTMNELRAKVKENLMHEAEHAARDKRRVRIVESLIEKTSFELPEVIIQSETDKMFATLEADIARAGSTFEEYVKHINKTREEMAIEFKPEAEKRGRFQFVLNAIARDAAIVPSDEEVDAETQKLLAMYPGADPARTKAYADMMLTNEKVLALIEGTRK